MTDNPAEPSSPATTDLLDAHPEAQAAQPVFQDYGGRPAFCGPAVTVRVFEDNVLVRVRLETPGEGRVLVVDGGGSLNCALAGGLLGTLGVQHGWAGLVVNGCVRDSAELRTLGLGVRALATHPRKSSKAGEGETDVTLTFAGVTVNPGDWVYVDADGVVVSGERLH